MERYSEIIAKLRKEELRNINLLNFMHNNPVLSVETAGESVLLRGQSDRIWVFISSSHEDELKTLKNKLDESDKSFAAIEEWMLPILVGDKELLWHLPMLQFYLPEDVVLPTPKYKTRHLSLEDAKILYENSTYQDAISLDYIEDRIRRGFSVGLYERDRLVAWGLTQDDGGIGFLHVLKDHRRKGYGYDVTLSLVEEVRKARELPFAYIEEDNVRAVSLVEKLGFIKYKKVHWFQLK